MLLPTDREKGERERWREFRSFRFIWLADVTNRINQDTNRINQDKFA